MIARFAVKMLLLGLSGSLALPLYSAEADNHPSPGATPALIETSATPAPALHQVTPGPADGRIAFLTASMLEQLHYLRQPFDWAVSGKFLDRYLETLDPQHLHFTQADLAGFEHYRTNLDRLTINRRQNADTTPAYEIFNRFLQRLEQRVAYVDELLKTEQFRFDTDERITANRHELPYPKDLDEAKRLWRERLRFEYLQEKLSRLEAKKKDEAMLARLEPTELPAKDSPKPDDAGAKAQTKPKSEAEEIVETLTRRYHRNLRTFDDWNNEDVMQVYLSTLAHVYDPHSDYMGPALLDSFSIGMSLSLFGIGAELGSEDGYCTIRRLLPGGPAIKSRRIKEKDRIVAVAQGDQPPVDIVDMSLSKAVQLIRGPKGTEVRLTIIPAGADASVRRLVTLIRDEIKLEDQEAKARIIELPSGPGQNLRLGVIDLPSFYATFDPSNTRGRTENKSTTADVRRLLTKLKQEHVAGVILDLRRNGGGSLEEAIKLTGLFIKEGPVVQVRNWKGDIEAEDDTDASVFYDGPLVVLTSRFSASASEILAGALQDYGRALIVGDSSTHGKGTVQAVNPLKLYLPVGQKGVTNDPGAVKITIKKFYRPSGASTQKTGVTPDIVLPSVANESKDVGESALENPLEGDSIPSAKFERLNLVAPYLADLRERSAQRVCNDQEFTYVREDIEQLKKLQADKTVSLNERQRLKEKEEAEARQKARDKERLARKEPQEKVYELTLRQVDQPGLPAPTQKTNSALAKLAHPDLAKPSAVATNSAAVAVAAKTPDDLPDEEKPSVDETMTETEHILVDYVSLLPKPDVLTAVH